MKAHIDDAEFGSIRIDNKLYEHDVVIRLNGNVEKRKKKLSKKIYGTSHTVSQQEAENIYEEGAEKIIIGSGMYGVLELSDKAKNFLKGKNIDYSISPTPKAVDEFNNENKKVIGMFHVTC